ncbi:hypothetical protein BGZ83_007781 [Gryganskiella cystojenkinii]|nr:hypothetical protein BGZ83_007781 [Gryganskiella cystojenkinii]
MLSAFAQSGLFIFFGTLAAVVIKAPWVSPFSWHPICMGIYGFVSTQAVLLLQPNLTGQRKEGGKTLHFFLLTVALISSIFGFRAIWNNKELVNKPHFHTNHAYLGGITLMIFLCQVLYGIIVGYAPATIYGRVGKARATRIHRVFGYTSITLLWATLWWGVLSSWMEKNFNGYQWIFALSMGMVAVGVVGQITPQRLWLKSRPSKRGEREVSPSDANAAVPSEQ